MDSKVRSITVVTSHWREFNVKVPDQSTGKEIKQCAMNQGAPIGANWQLQGHNANGSSRVIGDGEIPWQDVFDVVDIYDNA